MPKRLRSENCTFASPSAVSNEVLRARLPEARAEPGSPLREVLGHGEELVSLGGGTIDRNAELADVARHDDTLLERDTARAIPRSAPGLRRVRIAALPQERHET